MTTYLLSDRVTVKTVGGAVILCVEDEISGMEVHVQLTIRQAYEIAQALARAGYDIQRGTTS